MRLIQEPVPVPDLSSFQVDGSRSALEILVVAVLVALGVLALLSIPWVSRHPDRVGSTRAALVNVILFVLLFTWNWGHERDRNNRLEEQLWDLLRIELAVAEELSDRLETYYGIEFAEMPSFPERDDPPSYALVKEGERVKLCWVHVVNDPTARERLAISCGTHDAATSTELPVAAVSAGADESPSDEDATDPA